MFAVTETCLGLPLGQYLLVEYYCTEQSCDCRRVVLGVVSMESDKDDRLAYIKFGWERLGYYKKLYRNDAVARSSCGAALDEHEEQSEYAHNFLVLIKAFLDDHALVAKFRRHYKMVKDIPQQPDWTDLL